MPSALPDARIQHPGNRVAKVAKLIVASVAPGASNKQPIGTVQVDKSGLASYQVVGYTAGVPIWKTVAGGTPDPALPLTAEVSLTSAQVKALAATQIQLVAAPGAGKAIKYMGAQLKLVYGGTNGFTESGDNLGIKYTNASGVQVSNTIETTGFIDQTASTYTNAEPATDVIVSASAAENAALVLDNLNAEIAGNAANDNTLEISVLYRIVEL